LTTSRCRTYRSTVALRNPLISAVALLLLGLLADGAVEVKELPGKVRVEIDGELLTEYHYTGAPHVYFHPLIGPGGAKMTRSFPMENVEVRIAIILIIARYGMRTER
jgi:hypothetical protein